MKAYTLRIEDRLLDALKHIGIEEHKTVREILLEAITQKISSYKNFLQVNNIVTKEKLELEKISRILNKCSLNNAIKSIRDDRER